MGALFLANQTGKTDKVDFKKTLPGYKARVGQFQIVDIPVTRYLMIGWARRSSIQGICPSYRNALPRGVRPKVPVEANVGKRLCCAAS